MLRLQPSQVALTQSEVNEYKSRSEWQCVGRLMAYGAPRTTRFSESSECSTIPTVRRGPRRSRNEAVVHTSVSRVHSSASSQLEGYSDEVFGNMLSDDDRQSSSLRDEDQGNEDSGDTSEFRRDSVLSYEDSIALAGNDKRATRIEHVPFLNASEPSSEDLDSETGAKLQGPGPNVSDCPSSDFESLSTTASNHKSRTRRGEHETALSRSPAQRRRFRPRSFSDPCDTPIQSLQPARARRSTIPSRHIEGLPPTAHAGHVQTIPESHHEDDDPALGFESQLDDDSSETVPKRRGETAGNNTDDGRLLLPSPSPAQLTSQTDGSWTSPSFRPTKTGTFDLARERSAMLEAQCDRASPLDALSEGVQPHSGHSWTTNLPMRPRKPVPSQVPRMPTFESDEGSPTSSVYASSLESAAPVSSDAPWQRRPSVGRSIRSSSPPTSRTSTHRNNAGTARQSQPRPGVWDLGRSRAAELAVGQGGRPSFGSLRQGAHRQIRRRPVPNAEQENEEDMEQFEGERRARLARFEVVPGGVLDSTPPRQGRLESYLR